MIHLFNCKIASGKNKENKCFSKAVEGADRASNKLFESDKLEKSSIDRFLDSIVKNCEKRLNLHLTEDKESIEEYKKVKIYFKQLEECYIGMDKDKLESIINRF